MIGDNGCGDHLVYKIESDSKVLETVYVLDHETGKLLDVVSDFSLLDVRN